MIELAATASKRSVFVFIRATVLERHATDLMPSSSSVTVKVG